MPLTDPRDHSLLEHIYNEMHAARFINMEPLALLTNALSLYFIGACLLLLPPVPIPIDRFAYDGLYVRLLTCDFRYGSPLLRVCAMVAFVFAQTYARTLLSFSPSRRRL